MRENEVSGRADDLGDAALVAATGKSWTEWFEVLNTAGAGRWTHPEIASWVSAKHGVDGWWAQGVTVGFEQARGMRQPGQMADGTFSVGASRTVPFAPLDALDRAVEVLTAKLGTPPSGINRTAKFVTARWRLPSGERLLAQANPSAGSPPADAPAAADASTGPRTTVVLTHSHMPTMDAMAPARAQLRLWLDALTAPTPPTPPTPASNTASGAS
jgi:hypothetical protein